MSNKIEKKISIIGGGEGGGQAQHGNFHHVFTFFNLKPSLSTNITKHQEYCFGFGFYIRQDSAHVSPT